MAFLTPTKTDPVIKKIHKYTVTGTAISSSVEATFTGVPPHGSIVYFKATQTAGSATTIQPAFISDTGASQTGIDKIAKQTSAHTLADGPLIDASRVPYSQVSATTPGTMYLNLNVNSGSDNSFTVEVWFHSETLVS